MLRAIDRERPFRAEQMRRFIEIVILSCAVGCGAVPADIKATAAADTYRLKTVDGSALPAHTDESGSGLVVSGSRKVAPSGTVSSRCLNSCPRAARGPLTDQC